MRCALKQICICLRIAETYKELILHLVIIHEPVTIKLHLSIFDNFRHPIHHCICVHPVLVLVKELIQIDSRHSDLSLLFDRHSRIGLSELLNLMYIHICILIFFRQPVFNLACCPLLKFSKIHITHRLFPPVFRSSFSYSLLCIHISDKIHVRKSCKQIRFILPKAVHSPFHASDDHMVYYRYIHQFSGFDKALCDVIIRIAW